MGLLPSPVRAGSGSAGLWLGHTLSAAALPGGDLQLSAAILHRGRGCPPAPRAPPTGSSASRASIQAMTSRDDLRTLRLVVELVPNAGVGATGHTRDGRQRLAARGPARPGRRGRGSPGWGSTGSRQRPARAAARRTRARRTASSTCPSISGSIRAASWRAGSRDRIVGGSRSRSGGAGRPVREPGQARASRPRDRRRSPGRTARGGPDAADPIPRSRGRSARPSSARTGSRARPGRAARTAASRSSTSSWNCDQLSSQARSPPDAPAPRRSQLNVSSPAAAS